MPVSGEKYFLISSLAKGLKIMGLLGIQETMTVTALADAVGINRAGSHRFISTLRELGYVDKERKRNNFLSYELCRNFRTW